MFSFRSSALFPPTGSHCKAMLRAISSPRPLVAARQLSVLLGSIVRSSTTGTASPREETDVEQHNRLALTKKMRLLGMQSNQARKALAIYDDYVYRQKKSPDLRMFAVAINCAMVAEDLDKGRQIHQLIERDFPQWKDNLMLKQQLRYFYVKCNDLQSAEKLFRPSSTDTQQDKQPTRIDSDQPDPSK